jgi:hypothetical protein
LAIRFKLCNSRPNDNTIAYGDPTGRYACKAGARAFIHFSDPALASAIEAATARDPMVLFQRLGTVGPPRLITHVVLPIGDVLAHHNGPDHPHPHEMPVRVLAAFKAQLLRPEPHEDGRQRRASVVPAGASRINDVLWRAGVRVEPDFFVARGSAFGAYGGASICRDWLIATLENGHFELAPNALEELRAASQEGLNH